MAKNDNEKILAFRNQASILLDDLIALVRDDTLAGNLRAFNGEVMEKKPGSIGFDLKQARALKELTEQTLRQYASHTIRDDDLIRYSSEARMILQVNILRKEEKKMSFIKKLFPDKIEKEKENLTQLKAQHQEVLQDILACEKEKERCIRESRGASPDSMTYRNNERAYMAAKNKIILLQKTESSLSKMIDEKEKAIMIRTEAERSKKIDKVVSTPINGKGLEQGIATLEVNKEKMDAMVEQAGLMTADIFAEDPSLNTRTDSEFGAAMAADERRRATMMDAGFSESEMEKAENTAHSEFADMVSSDGNA